jgi:hypothetical protein
VPREIDGTVMHPLAKTTIRKRRELPEADVRMVQIEEPKRAAKTAA